MSRPTLQRRTAGYALPAVLAIVSILTLVFVAALAGLQSLRDETRAALDAADFQRAAMTAEARALYIATTEPLAADSIHVGGARTATSGAPAAPGTPGAASFGLGSGLGSGLSSTIGTPLYLDNRTYIWPDPATGRRYAFQLQDGAGLINLDFSRADALLRLFALAHVSQLAAQTLSDQIQDYIDGDDTRRQYGAESAEYMAAGRPPPPNGPMLRIEEVFGVLDWSRAIDAGRWRLMQPVLTADAKSHAFNVNTAPLGALEVVLNLSEAQARSAIGRRAQGPITDLTQIGLPAGQGNSAAFTFPNGSFRLSFSDPGRAAGYRSTIILTPNDPDRPAWVTSSDTIRLAPDVVARLKGANAFQLPDPLRRPAGT